MERRLAPLARAAIIAMVSICASCGGGAAPAALPASPASIPAASVPNSPADSAVINTTASTNTQAFSIYVTRGAAASKTYGSTVTQASLDPALAQRFFTDLDAANPLSALPVIFCAKPASFAVSTRVVYEGASSPDISCGGGPAAMNALHTDVDDITTALGGVPWN